MHEFFVTFSGKKLRRSEEGGNRRLIHKFVTLIDVAGKFCTAYCHYNQKEYSLLPFLRVHSSALQFLYAVAVVLKRLVDSFMSNNICEGRYRIPIAAGWNSVSAHGLTLSSLMVWKSLRGRGPNRVLRMTETEYKAVNAKKRILCGRKRSQWHTRKWTAIPEYFA